MQSNPQLSRPSNHSPALTKCNKQPWFVRGSIAAVMIFIMTGCAGSAETDANLARQNAASHSATPYPASENMNKSMSSNTNTFGGSSNMGGYTSANSNASQTSARDEETVTEAGGMAGVWNGTLRCDNGQSSPSVVKVAESGNPVFEYRDQSGAREVELSDSGQQVRYVPPGGGVVTVVVNSLATSSTHISFRLNVNSTKTSGSILDQSEGSLALDATLSGSELDVVMRMNSISVASQPGIVVPDDESQSVCRGRLRRE